jgi:WD40 repeat protein
MGIRKCIGKARWNLFAGVTVLACLVSAVPSFGLTLLGWLRCEPCYAGRPVSYWRYQFRDWRVSGWENLETLEELWQRREDDRQAPNFLCVLHHPGRWCLEQRETAKQLCYARLRVLKDHRKGHGACVNPTYGEPFCKLAIYDGDPDAVPVLTVLLQNEDLFIRRLAAAALGNMGSRGQAAYLALLETANHDEDAFVRGIACAALLDIDKQAAEKEGICESLQFRSPQPKARATISGHFILDSPRPFLTHGKILASDDVGETIRLYKVATGKVLASYHGPADIGLPIAFSPDGKSVASASKDKTTVKLWDLATGQERTTLRGHGDAIKSVTFSPDGKTLATGSSDKTVKLWDVVTGKELTSLQGHTGTIDHVVFSPNGKTLASGGGEGDCRVKLWEVATGKERATIQLDPKFGLVDCLAFSPDGKNLACGCGPWDVKLIDVATGKVRASHDGDDYYPWGDSVCFSPDSQTVASVSAAAVFLWDVATGKNTAKIYSKDGDVDGAMFSPDGRLLVVTKDPDAHRETLWEFAARRNESRR